MSFKLFKSLFSRITRINHEIEKEHKRIRPNELRLLKLKKMRLQIKDRLHRLLSQQRQLIYSQQNN
jgi:uncharacterized protein YdcH (DUF465 family)